jgi:hypothetical protein
VTKRDIEAYFLYWASQENGEKQYVKMAIGLRSGVMDLFTFIGIPTVSIGVRNMVGEVRHALLVGKGFERVNIQYDKPRHQTTTYVENKTGGDTLLTSPYWNGDPLGGATVVERIDTAEDGTKYPVKELKKKNANCTGYRDKMQTKEPKDFTEFGKFVMVVGIRLACHEYIQWPESIKIVGEKIPAVVTTSEARFCFLATEKDVKERLPGRKKNDLKAITDIQGTLSDPNTSLQLSGTLWEKYYMRPHENNWKKVEKGS